jgi:hypothetical protein
MARFQPSSHSYGSVEDAQAASERTDLSLTEAKPSFEDFLSEQVKGFKAGMTETLNVQRLTVTIIGGAVAMVGTGLVAAWLERTLSRRRAEKAVAEGGPSGEPMDLICTPRDQ